MNLNGEVERLQDDPCSGWCTTRQWGDSRCKGCGRYENEIAQWGSLSDVYRKLRVLENSEDGYPIRHMNKKGWRPVSVNLIELP